MPAQCPDAYLDELRRYACRKTGKLCEHQRQSDYPDKRLILTGTANHCRYREMTKEHIEAEKKEEAKLRKAKEKRRRDYDTFRKMLERNR